MEERYEETDLAGQSLAVLNPEVERLKTALAGFEKMECQLRLGIAHLKVVLAQLEASPS